jgi:hypothetical protein
MGAHRSRCNACTTVVASGVPRAYSELMDRAITHHEITNALIAVLRRHGIVNTDGAVKVLGPPDYAVRLFGVILSDCVKPLLASHFARATGRLHATVGDVWILTDSETATLLGYLRNHFHV